MSKITRALVAALLALVMAVSGMTVAVAEGADKVVNIAVTDTIESLNPILVGATEVSKYAMSLSFLPLVEMDAQLEFVPQLASEITTEDNITFTIKLQEAAVWSDGEPVTTKDVLFTLLLLASPICGNPNMAMYALEGLDDSGLTEEGATSISGVELIDDKTMTVKTKWPTALYTFENNYGRYVMVLPEHVLKDVPQSELQSSTWFNAPTVVDGPYIPTSVDLNHYVYYTANESYFLGAPRIRYLNLNVVDPAQLLTGLRSGEIDVVQQTMGSILLEDYDAIAALDNVTAVMGTPITNQSTFINVQNVPDVRVRQALRYGLDRETIFNGLIHGNGEIVDAFLCSASPYYSEALGVTEYDPARAKELLDAAAADGFDMHLTWHVNSGDATFVQAAQYIAATFAELGLDIEVITVDLSTLMTVAGGDDMQVMTVQYTYSPVDPYTDVSWLLSADGWTHYDNETVAAALADSQAQTDVAAIVADYLTVDTLVNEDVPMLSVYIISLLGAVSNRMVNVQPDVFGTFVNVHEWDVA